jgi:hypothetical protein
MERDIVKNRGKKRSFFSQKYFGILKIGQKKCPKMKTRKKFWKFSMPHCIKKNYGKDTKKKFFKL